MKILICDGDEPFALQRRDWLIVLCFFGNYTQNYYLECREMFC